MDVTLPAIARPKGTVPDPPMQRSNSCVETRHRCHISSDRLVQLRRRVDIALREHRVFTIRGNWGAIRRELSKREWIEKFEPGRQKTSTMMQQTAAGPEDLVGNLPVKQDWESQTAYVDKCERMIMSRMLANYDVDFYWSLRRDQSDAYHRSNTCKLMNRFNRSIFASKEGLALLLQQFYWYVEPGVAYVNFPRCFVLGFPDHFNNFVENYRMTACIGLLKWFIAKYESTDKKSITEPDGIIPCSTITFAIDRCSEYVSSQKHHDIDVQFERIWDHEWSQFIKHYTKIVHSGEPFMEERNHCLLTSYTDGKRVLKDVALFWPEYDMEGMRNIWILKPGNKCRGRGIQLVKRIDDVEKAMNLKLKYVVQKYIEKPLLIYNTKFDIRQWFLVASSQPLTIWMYRESYLRFSSQIFTLDNFHESLHLTNYAVQCKYPNVKQRDKALPADNMWHCNTFKEYLNERGLSDKWDEIIYPGMRQGIVCAMLASQDTMDRRQNTFELYGADFMLSEDFRPWLLEINCSPDLSHSTSVTSKLCPRCLEDVIKVMIDRRRDPNSDTGKFDLVYKQSPSRPPPYLGINLCVRGRRVFKGRHRKQRDDRPPNGDKENCGKERISRYTMRLGREESPKSQPYKGPIIENFMDDLGRAVAVNGGGQNKGVGRSGVDDERSPNRGVRCMCRRRGVGRKVGCRAASRRPNDGKAPERRKLPCATKIVDPFDGASVIVRNKGCAKKVSCFDCLDSVGPTADGSDCNNIRRVKSSSDQFGNAEWSSKFLIKRK